MALRTFRVKNTTGSDREVPNNTLVTHEPHEDWPGRRTIYVHMPKELKEQCGVARWMFLDDLEEVFPPGWAVTPKYRPNDFYFNEPKAKKVLDRETNKLLSEVYSRKVGYLGIEDAVPFKTFRIGRFGYYWNPWKVAFYEFDLRGAE